MAAGGGALSRLAARLSWALLKRERMGIDELGNAYYRWAALAALPVPCSWGQFTLFSRVQAAALVT